MYNRMYDTPNDVAWKKFGTPIAMQMSIEEIIRKAELDYNVTEQPLVRIPQHVLDSVLSGQAVDFHLTPNMVIKNKKATLREDTDITLGVVGDGYQIIQNTKAFEFIDFIEQASGKKAVVETAGKFGNGERMFVSCKLESIFLGDDEISNYIVFTNTHDGSGGVMAFFTPIRVICQNTLNMAIRGAENKYVVKHTKNAEHRLDWNNQYNIKRAEEVFGKNMKFSETFLNTMLKLKDEKVDTQYVDDITAKLYLGDRKFKLYVDNGRKFEGLEDDIKSRAKNKIQTLRDSIDSGIGQDKHRGTKLWVLNGLTTMLHSETKYKSDEDEMLSLMGGDGLKKVQWMYNELSKAA